MYHEPKTTNQHWAEFTLHEKVEQAKALKPLFVNSLMGLTTMLFDNEEGNDLRQFGQISTPSLADIFVGVMAKEIY